jgi:alpha,alpha-trehalose phosphorylase (configuration-retaining)
MIPRTSLLICLVHIDRLLDALMRGADLACQVSTREGFEIKVCFVFHFKWKTVFDAYLEVTEAIHKTRWIIATKAGGIPLQIRDGKDGILVPPGDAQAISGALYDFYASGKDQEHTGEQEGNVLNRPLGGRWTDEGRGPREELFSIGNATMWMFLWNAALGPNPGQDENVKQKLECLGLKPGQKKELRELNGQMVWDHLAISKDSPGSKCD